MTIMCPKMVRLYSHECMDLLRKALDKAEADSSEPILSRTRRQRDEGDSSEEEDSEDSDSSSYSEHDEETAALERSNDEELTTAIATNTLTAEVPVKPKPNSDNKRPPKKNQKEQMIQQMGTPPFISLPVSDTQALHVPSALLTKHEKFSDHKTQCSSLLEMTTKIAAPQPLIVLLLRSGRFAGGVFLAECCLAHRACQRYTVRRGQGKAQSSLDSSKRKANSMGAQLRRAGEANLWEDVQQTVQLWKTHLDNAPLILVSCPNTMQKGFYEATAKWRTKMRKIPLDIGRPTFESVLAVHEIMTQATVKQVVAMEQAENEPIEELVAEDAVDVPRGTDREKPVQIKDVPPLTPLHEFAAEGNVPAIEELLETDASSCAELMDLAAGQDLMTPLHYAAEYSKEDANASASMVSLLLLQGKANPCCLDGRNRVAYFLASHEKTREAFRRARAELGEKCWAWDAEAKVGPALSTEDMERKQEKEAEKKRRQRARQKEKKARDKAQAQEMAERAKQDEEERKQDEDANRIRDGLTPKTSTATNVCDFCQKTCKGKRRSQMFQRLDYAYCSSECVQKHKRELMAQAAMSRLG